MPPGGPTHFLAIHFRQLTSPARAGAAPRDYSLAKKRFFRQTIRHRYQKQLHDPAKPVVKFNACG
jgi:hypothetical protein